MNTYYYIVDTDSTTIEPLIYLHQNSINSLQWLGNLGYSIKSFTSDKKVVAGQIVFIELAKDDEEPENLDWNHCYSTLVSNNVYDGFE